VPVTVEFEKTETKKELEMSRYSWVAAMAAMSWIGGCAKPAAVERPEVTATAADAPSAVAADPAHSVTIEVPGMMCEHGCPPFIKETLVNLPGVTDVTVDFPTKTAVVSVEDKEKFDAEAAVQALVAGGYKDSTVKN
jgi:copper chaperone CopZ